MMDTRWNISGLKTVNKILELTSQVEELKNEIDIDSISAQIEKSWGSLSQEVFYDEDILLICLSLARKAVLDLRNDGERGKEILEKYKNHFKLFD